MTDSDRSVPLDVLRGMTVALMIVVNTPGDGATTFAPLKHAAWHGFTPTDLVFPTFMFVVGAAMSLSLAKYRTDSAFLAKVARRTALIFLLGYLMYWFPFVHREAGQLVGSPIGQTRIFGVLQRVALGYGFAALIIWYGGRRGAIIFSVAALLGYWAILSTWGDYSLTGNAVLRLDRFLMGDGHLYHGEGLAFDPEGLLSTLPAIVNTIAGYLAGTHLKDKGPGYETVAKLMIAGAAAVTIALCWNPFFPINKKIWSSSFVLLTVGLDLVGLAVLVYVIDIRRQRAWAGFFQVFGRNTLFCYLLSELGVTLLLVFRNGDRSLYKVAYESVYQPFGGYVGSLLFAVSWMLVCWLAGLVLDRRGIHLKI